MLNKTRADAHENHLKKPKKPLPRRGENKGEGLPETGSPSPFS